MRCQDFADRLYAIKAGDYQAFSAWEKAACAASVEYFILHTASHAPEEYGYVALRFSERKGDILVLSHYPNLRRLRKLERKRGTPVERAPAQALTWLFR